MTKNVKSDDVPNSTAAAAVLPPELNVVVVGKQGVGKSCFITRAVGGPDRSFLSPPPDTVLCSQAITVQCAAPMHQHPRTHDHQQGELSELDRRSTDAQSTTGLLRLVLWESPSSPELDSVANVLAQSADAVLLLADASAQLLSVESSVPLWMKQSAREALPAALFVVTKTDAAPDSWVATRSRVRDRVAAIEGWTNSTSSGARAGGGLVMRETSAKLGVNVTETLEDLGRMLLESSPALAQAAISAARYHAIYKTPSTNGQIVAPGERGQWKWFPFWRTRRSEIDHVREEGSTSNKEGGNQQSGSVGVALAGVTDVWPELEWWHARELVARRTSNYEERSQINPSERAVERAVERTLIGEENEDSEDSIKTVDETDAVQQLRKTKALKVVYCPRGCGAALSIVAASPRANASRFSGATAAVSSSHLHQHLAQSCPKQLVPCPLQCGLQLERQSVVTHTQEFCSKRLVACKVRGCGTLVPRDELQSHQFAFRHTPTCDWDVTHIKHFIAFHDEEGRANPRTDGGGGVGSDAYLSDLEELGAVWTGDSFVQALQMRSGSCSSLVAHLGPTFTQVLLDNIQALKQGAAGISTSSSRSSSSNANEAGGQELETNLSMDRSSHDVDTTSATAGTQESSSNSRLIGAASERQKDQGSHVRQAAQQMRQLSMRTPGPGTGATGTAFVGPDRVLEAMQRRPGWGSGQREPQLFRGFSAPDASGVLHGSIHQGGGPLLPVPASLRPLPSLPLLPETTSPPPHNPHSAAANQFSNQGSNQKANAHDRQQQLTHKQMDRSSEQRPPQTSLPNRHSANQGSNQKANAHDRQQQQQQQQQQLTYKQTDRNSHSQRPPPPDVAAAAASTAEDVVASVYPPKFARMLKAGLPLAVVHHAMKAQGVAMDAGLAPTTNLSPDSQGPRVDPSKGTARGDGGVGDGGEGVGQDDDELPPKFARMLKAGLPMAAVQHAMKAQGVSMKQPQQQQHPHKGVDDPSPDRPPVVTSAQQASPKDRGGLVGLVQSFNRSALKPVVSSDKQASPADRGPGFAPNASKQDRGGLVGLLQSFDRSALKPVIAPRPTAAGDRKNGKAGGGGAPSLVDLLGSFNRSSLRHVPARDTSSAATKPRGSGDGPLGMSDALAMAIEKRRRVIDGRNDGSGSDSNNDDDADSSTSSDWR